MLQSKFPCKAPVSGMGGSLLKDKTERSACLGKQGVAEVGHELRGGQVAHFPVAERLEGLLQRLVEQRAAVEALCHILQEQHEQLSDMMLRRGAQQGCEPFSNVHRIAQQVMWCSWRAQDTAWVLNSSYVTFTNLCMMQTGLMGTMHWGHRKGRFWYAVRGATAGEACYLTCRYLSCSSMTVFTYVCS